MTPSRPIYRGPNAALLLAVALPAFAILASVGTALIATTSGDPPLPGQYHWEGDKLDHDFAQVHRAVALGLDAELDLRPSHGVCHLLLQLNSAMPAEVLLDVIHASRPELDRQMRFTRRGSTAEYAAPCAPLPVGRWHLELKSGAGDWSYRQDWTGNDSPVTLSSAVRG